MFPGWKHARAELSQRRGAPINPKDWLRERYDLVITLKTIDGVVAVAHERGLEPSPTLKAAIAQLLRSVDAGPPPPR